MRGLLWMAVAVVMGCGSAHHEPQNAGSGQAMEATNRGFARAVAQALPLGTPPPVAAFSDVTVEDSDYSAIQMIAPHLHRQVLCPGCLLGSRFAPAQRMSRAQAAIIVVSALAAANRLALTGPAETSRLIATVSDAQRLSPDARTYLATALQHGLIALDADRGLRARVPASPAELMAMLGAARAQIGGVR